MSARLRREGNDAHVSLLTILTRRTALLLGATPLKSGPTVSTYLACSFAIARTLRSTTHRSWLDHRNARGFCGSLNRHALTTESIAKPLGQQCRTITDFEALASNGAATADHALSCLQHTRASLRDLRLEERQRRYAELQTGARTLNWLWSNHPRSNDSVYTQRTFCDTLALVHNTRGARGVRMAVAASGHCGCQFAGQCSRTG